MKEINNQAPNCRQFLLSNLLMYTMNYLNYYNEAVYVYYSSNHMTLLKLYAYI